MKNNIKHRKMMLHLAEATLARYERVAARGRAHPPDFNALMMRICTNIVEERSKGKTLVEVLDSDGLFKGRLVCARCGSNKLGAISRRGQPTKYRCENCGREWEITPEESVAMLDAISDDEMFAGVDIKRESFTAPVRQTRRGTR